MHSVDVIVPCYNYGRYLRECVESVTSQRGVEVRVLIIDDASSDNSAEVGMRLAEADSRVTFVRHTQNRGHIATYNEGLQWVNRDYTLLLSADDMLTPGALYRATSLMESHPTVGFVFGRCIRLVEGQPVERTPSGSVQCDGKVWNGFAWLKFVCKDRSWFMDSPAVLVRTQMYRTVGVFRPDLPHTADLDLWLRFAAHADVGELDADQAYYRIHQTNMHGSLAPTALQSLEHWNAAYTAFFEHSGSRLPNERGFRQWAAESIARNALNAAYARKYRGDVATRRKLIDLALRTAPEMRTTRGLFAAGAESGRIRQPWATRRLLGAPAYLFRRIADHGWRALRCAASADVMGATFEAGRVWGHATLVADAWRGTPGPAEAARVSGEIVPVRLSEDTRTAA